ncbi:MAG: hypothetical protein ALECFALPRED_010144 [Alectoria fallacina]|uniref:BTB domain-containing protein n=1 Tax=Alectoria fallacina TaxID=1903189 RepID=A0A8H3J910_9LECA|nr:MAG: hypothetical protein ALECFALPRED_010144 [Alectoria fallacina]
MATATPVKILTPAKHKFGNVSTVTLLVGKNKTPFHVHMDRLCEASSVFEAAFLGNFKESSEKTMQLPEDDEGTFELFVDWLYGQRYAMLPEVEKGHEDYEKDKRFLQAYQLFVLADKYRVCKLKSLVIEALFADVTMCKGVPSNASVAYAYEHTTQCSGLRKWLADYHAWNVRLEWYELSDAQAFLRQQPDFATDLSVSFAERIKRGPGYNPFKGNMPDKYKDSNHEQET